MVTFQAEAPPLPKPVISDQFWADLTFIHWPVDPARVAKLFPPGTRPDTFADGLTYVGLVPFVMRHTAIGASLRVPYFGSFPETNVRLYSVDDEGRHGVYFRSLETARLAVVGVCRAVLGIPYTWAGMRVTRDGDVIAYDSTRRWPRRGLRCRVAVRIGAPVQPSPLDVWLTARWGAHTRKAGRTWWVPNEHPSWLLRAAEIVALDQELVSAAGVETAGGPLHALFSDGVPAQFGRPEVVA